MAYKTAVDIGKKFFQKNSILIQKKMDSCFTMLLKFHLTVGYAENSMS